jgi:hypothetical protein
MELCLRFLSDMPAVCDVDPAQLKPRCNLAVNARCDASRRNFVPGFAEVAHDAELMTGKSEASPGLWIVINV